MFVVAIDAGHQANPDMGPDPIGPGATETKPKDAGGAEGVTTHVPESLVNLEVALKLEKILEARGIRVVMVRNSQDVDISSSHRAEVANRAHADLFLRLHCDGASSSGEHGIQTLVPGRDRWTGPILAPSMVAGRSIQSAAIAATGASNLGVTRRTDLAGFNWSKVPSVLVEMGFLSDPPEEHRLVSPAYQERLAEGIANGTVRYLQTLE